MVKITNLFLTPEREAPPPPPIISWFLVVNPRPNTGIPTDTLKVGQLINIFKDVKEVCKGKTKLGTNPVEFEDFDMMPLSNQFSAHLLDTLNFIIIKARDSLYILSCNIL